jgi:hypothetical protein
MFWPFFPKIGQNFNNFSDHTGHNDCVNYKFERFDADIWHVLAISPKNWAKF